jgi:hypothetical protein
LLQVNELAFHKPIQCVHVYYRNNNIKMSQAMPGFSGFFRKGGMRARRETKTNRPQRSKILAMQQRTCSMGDTARTPFFVRLYKSRLSSYSADLLFNDH